MASNESRDRKLTPLGWKWCGRCGETKKLGEFNPVTVKRACRTVRQPNNWCKSCLADIHKKKKKAEG